MLLRGKNTILCLFNNKDFYDSLPFSLAGISN